MGPTRGGEPLAMTPVGSYREYWIPPCRETVLRFAPVLDLCVARYAYLSTYTSPVLRPTIFIIRSIPRGDPPL